MVFAFHDMHNNVFFIHMFITSTNNKCVTSDIISKKTKTPIATLEILVCLNQLQIPLHPNELFAAPPPLPRE